MKQSPSSDKNKDSKKNSKKLVIDEKRKLREKERELLKEKNEYKRLKNKKINDIKRIERKKSQEESKAKQEEFAKYKKAVDQYNRKEIKKLSDDYKKFVLEKKNELREIRTDLERKRINKEISEQKKYLDIKIKEIRTGKEHSAKSPNVKSSNSIEKTNYAIEMLGIHKEFLGGKIIAIDHIDFRVKTGTIHALIGENGSGKSTLMNTIFGIYSLDKGEMKLFENHVKVKDSRHANELGIGMVHQHFKLVNRFTVLENILMGQEEVKKINSKYIPVLENGKIKEVSKTKGRETIIIDEAESRKHFNYITHKYNLVIDPDAIVGDLPVDLKQKVEIIKVLWNPKSILIFDEPTASLGNVEIKSLLNTMKELRSKGITIIFTSHKLEEIKSVADEATVLTNGKSVLNMPISEKMDTSKIVEAMIGEKVTLDFQKLKNKQNIVDESVLEVKNLFYRDEDNVLKVNDVSFNIKRGEIFGIAGVADNGQVEIADSIAGLKNPNSGNILVENNSILNLSVNDRNKILSHVPSDRHKWGVINSMSIYDNATFKDINTRLFSKIFISKNSSNYADFYKLKKELRKELKLAKYDEKKILLIKKIDELTKKIEVIKSNSKSQIKEYKNKYLENKSLLDIFNKDIKKYKNELKKLKKDVSNTDKKIRKYEEKAKKFRDTTFKFSKSSSSEEKESQLKVFILEKKVADLNLAIKALVNKKENASKKIVLADKNLVMSKNNLTSQISEVEKLKIEFLNNSDILQTKSIESILELKNLKDSLNNNLKSIENSLEKDEISLRKNKIENDLKKLEIDLISKKTEEANNLSKLRENKLNDQETKNYKELFLNQKGQNLVVDKKSQEKFTSDLISNFDVRGLSSVGDQFLVLSGGNQQKFVVGREISRSHNLLLASYPTRGLDIFAIKNLYIKLLEDVIKNNTSSLLISHEIDELVAVCDRIAILDQGKIVEVIENKGPKKVIVNKISSYILGGGIN